MLQIMAGRRRARDRAKETRRRAKNSSSQLPTSHVAIAAECGESTTTDCTGDNSQQTGGDSIDALEVMVQEG
jgi:hypothetical protein